MSFDSEDVPVLLRAEACPFERLDAAVRDTCHDTWLRVPSRAERTWDSGARSSVFGPARHRPPARGNGYGDEEAVSDSRYAGRRESRGVHRDALDPRQW